MRYDGHEDVQPDGRVGEDNLDYWAHDAEYARRHAGHRGDATDPFDGDRFTMFTPDTNPASYGSWTSAAG